MNELTEIRPLSDQDAASSVSAAALAELAEMITSMPLRTDQRQAHRRFGWLRRKIAVGGFGVPVVVAGVVATAAAATGAVVAVSATTIFENNPQQASMPVTITAGGHEGVVAPDPETVIPSAVRELASATIPDYGEVQFWGAPTKQGGFCQVLKLPDGSWGGYPSTLHPTGGWVEGTVPGCTSTQETQVIAEPAVPAGEHLTNADDGLSNNGDMVGPTPVEQWSVNVKSSTGQVWNVDFGYVEVEGTATTVRDPANGATAPVTADGYYILVEHSDLAGGNLQVLNAAGQKLQPDYTYGGLLPSYAAGPTKG